MALILYKERQLPWDPLVASFMVGRPRRLVVGTCDIKRRVAGVWPKQRVLCGADMARKIVIR